MGAVVRRVILLEDERINSCDKAFLREQDIAVILSEYFHTWIQSTKNSMITPIFHIAADTNTNKTSQIYIFISPDSANTTI